MLIAPQHGVPIWIARLFHPLGELRLFHPYSESGQTSQTMTREEEILANAVLIAAAPDLLAERDALRAMLERVLAANDPLEYADDAMRLLGWEMPEPGS